MPDFLSPQDFVLLKWIIILVAWGLLAVGLYYDNVRMRKLRENSTTNELILLLNKRNLHIFGLFTMVLFIVVTNDVSHTLVQPPQSTPVVVMESPPTPAVVAASTKGVISEPADTNAFAIPHDSKILFSDITEFNEQNGKQQAYLDLLKQRYETWFITFFYLQKCSKVSNQDYSVIMTSLLRS